MNAMKLAVGVAFVVSNACMQATAQDVGEHWTVSVREVVPTEQREFELNEQKEYANRVRSDALLSARSGVDPASDLPSLATECQQSAVPSIEESQVDVLDALLDGVVTAWKKAVFFPVSTARKLGAKAVPGRWGNGRIAAEADPAAREARRQSK